MKMNNAKQFIAFATLVADVNTELERTCRTENAIWCRKARRIALEMAKVKKGDVTTMSGLKEKVFKARVGRDMEIELAVEKAVEQVQAGYIALINGEVI